LEDKSNCSKNNWGVLNVPTTRLYFNEIFEAMLSHKNDTDTELFFPLLLCVESYHLSTVGILLLLTVCTSCLKEEKSISVLIRQRTKKENRITIE
jgi:hypothetical protein